MKLNDLLKRDMTELSAMHNISEDILQEPNSVVDHADSIIGFFWQRAKRNSDILPNVQDALIESLKFGTRVTNVLKRSGIHTVGALIQMSQKVIFELHNVGILSREEITNAIDSNVKNSKVVCFEREEIQNTDIAAVSEISGIFKTLLEIESVGFDDVLFNICDR